MLGAIVKNNIVEDVIVLNPEQIEELEQALECKIIDARPYGLVAGDLRTERGWTRNADGEQILLPELEPKEYDSYSVAMDLVRATEEQVEIIAETIENGINAILTGKIEDETKPIPMMARVALDNFIISVADVPQQVNDYSDFVREWQPGEFTIGDVRKYNEIPYKCVQSHNSTGNDAWTPDTTPALWMAYHGTSEESAREWVQPTGAHDQYLSGEWVIFDGEKYKCLFNTVYSPRDYSYAWEKH